LKIFHPESKPTGEHYVEITNTPLQAGANLHQYKLQAVTPVEQGELKASIGQPVRDHIYDKTFKTPTSLDAFYLYKGNASGFQSGNAVTIRCMYPKKFSKGGEHCLKIIARAYDIGRKVVATKEEEVVLTF